MSERPDVCVYCHGTGEGPGCECGFCNGGKPLDAQEDWDRTWGRVGDAMDRGTEDPS